MTLAALGAATLAALLALTVLAVKVGGLSVGGGSEYRLIFTDATGIPDNADVRIAGIPVGNVRRLALAPEGGAEVWIAVHDGIDVYDDARAIIKQKGLLGERFIELRRGTSGHKLASGAAITDTVTPLRVEDLGEVLGPLVDGVDTGQLTTLIADLVDFLMANRETLAAGAEEIGETIRRVNALLGTHGDDVGRMIRHADALAVRLDRFLGSNEKELSTVLGDIAALTADMRELSGAIGSAAKAFPAAGTDAVALITRLNRLAASLESSDPWAALLVLKKMLQEEGITVNLFGTSDKGLRKEVESYRAMLTAPTDAPKDAPRTSKSPPLKRSGGR